MVCFAMLIWEARCASTLVFGGRRIRRAVQRERRDEPSESRQMKLGAFLMAGGHHIGAWRHPDAVAEAGVDIDHFIGLAQMAEAAKLDMIFVEDAAAIRERDVNIASQAARSTGFEPLSLLAALAVNTSHIGLVATASTTYNDPYGLARTFASIDQLSGGRAG